MPVSALDTAPELVRLGQSLGLHVVRVDPNADAAGVFRHGYSGGHLPTSPGEGGGASPQGDQQLGQGLAFAGEIAAEPSGVGHGQRLHAEEGQRRANGPFDGTHGVAEQGADGSHPGDRSQLTGAGLPLGPGEGEPGEDEVSTAAEQGLFLLAAGEGGLEGRAEHSQGSGQHYQDGQRAVGEGSPGHADQGEGDPGRGGQPGEPRQEPDQRRQHPEQDEGGREEGNRRTEEQDRVQFDPGPGQCPSHQATLPLGLPEEKAEDADGKDIDVVAVQKGDGRRTGAGTQELQYLHPGQADVGNEEDRGTEQTGAGGQGEHIPGQSDGNPAAVCPEGIDGAKKPLAGHHHSQEGSQDQGGQHGDALSQHKQSGHLEGSSAAAAETAGLIAAGLR